jgi:hypothetical protein
MAWHGSMDGLPLVPGLLGRVPSLQINTMDEPSPFRVGLHPNHGPAFESGQSAAIAWFVAQCEMSPNDCRQLVRDSNCPVAALRFPISRWCVALLVPSVLFAEEEADFPSGYTVTARFCRNVPLPTKTLVKPNCACPAQLRWVEFTVTTRGPADCRRQGSRSAHA